VQQAATINKIVTVAKVLPIILFILILAVSFKGHLFAANFWGGEGMPVSGIFDQVKATMLITTFVFIGIEGASVYSRYAQKRSDVGVATIFGFIGVTALMVLVTLLRIVRNQEYFYRDWNLDIWRCEAWNEPLGSVFDLDRIPDQREPCNACMMACDRNASMLMHAAVAATDAVRALAAGQVGSAVSSLFRRSVAQSLWALVEETPRIRRLARSRRQTASTKGPLPSERLADDRAEA
jgi:hypothetical protein